MNFEFVLDIARPVPFTYGPYRMYLTLRHDLFSASESMTALLLQYVTLHWLPVQQRIDYKLCVLVYKCLHQGAPVYLSELCIPVASSTGRNHLCVQRRKNASSSVTAGLRTTGSEVSWNSLPLTFRDKSMSLSQFCPRLKT